MNLINLLEKARRNPVFSLEDCRKWFPGTSRATTIVQLSHFSRRGIFIRLKRGLFACSNPLPHPWVIASRLQEQAMIGLETVLHQAGLTPEVPFTTVSVTPRKTARFQIPIAGTFLFRHLAPRLCFGWKIHSFPPYSLRVMEPEKALLDMLWFHRFEKDPVSYVKELRLTIPSSFSWAKFIRYATLFQDRFLEKIAKAIVLTYR